MFLFCFRARVSCSLKLSMYLSGILTSDLLASTTMQATTSDLKLFLFPSFGLLTNPRTHPVTQLAMQFVSFSYVKI